MALKRKGIEVLFSSMVPNVARKIKKRIVHCHMHTRECIVQPLIPTTAAHVFHVCLWKFLNMTGSRKVVANLCKISQV